MKLIGSIFVLFCLSILYANAHSSCKHPRDRLIGDRCYAFISKKHHYLAARDYCHSESMFLATIDNVIDAKFVASSAVSEFSTNNGEFWIGLERTHEYSLFEWDDETPFAYNNFGNGYPNKNDYVAERINDGKWVTLHSSKELPFVCSYNYSTVPTTTTTTTTRIPTTTKKDSTISTTTTTTTTLPTTTKRTTCPDGFRKFQNKCYLIVDYGKDSDYEPVSENAPPLTKENQRCQKYGATVASIHSKEINNYARSFIYEKYNDTRYTTIGLRNVDQQSPSGKWEWIDGSATDYVNFGNTFPRRGDLITQMSANGLYWVSFTHTSANEGVICEIDLS